MEYVKGEDNIADVLTKDLAYNKFSEFARVIMQGELNSNYNLGGILGYHDDTH
jgi:hypothetical protein